MPTMSEPPERPDRELVALARGGDQAAYGRLVARHQVLVVSVAYSVCGDFAGSQDIAQEAFVAAWRQLSTLEDAVKFKAWVCGIARNLGRNFVRQETRRLERETGSLDHAPESGAGIPGPREATVSREEAALVWAALETLPEAYREPLVLFYREQQSVERVATALDLSVDTVKQRLSRGRAMVREQVEGLGRPIARSDHPRARCSPLTCWRLCPSAHRWPSHRPAPRPGKARRRWVLWPSHGCGSLWRLRLCSSSAS